MPLELFAGDCQVSPTCHRKCDHMGDTHSPFSLLNLLAVTHAEWMVNDEVFIPLSLTSIFPCGTNELVPGFISDFFGQWALSLALPLLPFLMFYYQ
jgi:hypothetical protein